MATLYELLRVLTPTGWVTPVNLYVLVNTGWVRPVAVYVLDLVPPPPPPGHVGNWLPAPDDWIPGWRYLGAGSAPTVAPLAGTMSVANYMTLADFNNSARPAGSVERDTWYSVVEYRDVDNGGLLVPQQVLQPGTYQHSRNWGSSYDGRNTQFRVAFRNELGTGPFGDWSNIVTISTGV